MQEADCESECYKQSLTCAVSVSAKGGGGAAYGGCGQIDIPDGRDIANWQATAPEALIEMGRLDDALSFVDAYKRCYDVQKGKLPYGNSLPVECSRSVFFRALILSLQEKNAEAERTIQVALRNAPSPYLYSFKVALLPLYIWNRGRRDITIEPLLREFAPDSRDDISWLLPAAAGLRLVNPKVSRILLNRATDLLSVANAGKQSVEDVARTAELFTELGCAVQAKRILNQALEEGTTGADSFERVRIQLAFANLKQNNYRQAHEELDAVAERLVKPETLRQFLIAKAAISDGERNDSAAEKFYRRVYEMTRWSPRVEVMDKVFCLEKYAQFCNRIGKEDKAKSLHAEAESILPRRCREPWRTWKLVTPLFPYNRPLGLYDS